MQPSVLEIFGTVVFACAVIHTFCTSYLHRQAERFREGSVGENVFHFLGEVEAVFGIWAAVFIGGYSLIDSFTVYDPDHKLIGGALYYLESQNFTEPAFVFVIMCIAATRPVIWLAEKSIVAASKLLPLPRKMAFYVAVMLIGPILGSLITEPAAMTVTALLLLQYFYKNQMSEKFKYASLGLLFVNVSVGGTLTHFAAPPVLMVATKYGWGIDFMLRNFGWKAIIGMLIATTLTTLIFRKELSGPLKTPVETKKGIRPVWWVIVAHLMFMAVVVATAHHMVFFMGVFLFFIGFTVVTQEYQDELRLKESLLVGFFLGGLVVMGTIQKWWLQDLITQMEDTVLFFGATFLTALTDNAALTYLGSLVDLSDTAKYSLVAGAVTGGGLTVIANAPNPAGFGILKSSFDGGAINPFFLFVGALMPTAILAACFMLLPAL